MRSTVKQKRLPADIRREQILESALVLLSQKGYSKFTTRNIAKQAGVHFATLQYYFKNKNDLVIELFEFKLAKDNKLFHDTLQAAGKSKKQLFSSTIQTVLSDCKKSLNVGYCLEFWALSNQNETLKSYIQKFYDAYEGWVIELINIVNPKISSTNAKLRAQSILTMLEGYVPVYAFKTKGENPDTQFDDHLENVVWLIATSKEKL